MTTLNSLQQQSYSKAQQLARILRKSKRIYKEVTPFADEVNTFLQHLDSIPEQAIIKATKGIAITAQKKELKKEIAREVSDVCSLATAYALKTKNHELLYRLRSTSYTDIYAGKDGDIRIRILCLVHALTPYLSNETFLQYGITSGDITSISEKGEQFSSIMNSGRRVNWESDYASQTITATFKKISASIKQMQRLLILFKAKNPGFIEDFREALVVEKKTSHNSIEGAVTDSQTAQPVPNVTITAEGTNKKAITNSNGFYHINSIKVGTHHLTITAEGYAPQTIAVKVVRGRAVQLNISLEAKAFSLPETKVA